MYKYFEFEEIFCKIQQRKKVRIIRESVRDNNREKYPEIFVDRRKPVNTNETEGRTLS